jgi:Protein of unknown function (DUF2778)
MAWAFEQSTGYLISPTGHRMEPPGYAGHAEGLNNPAMQNVVNVGPIPQGWYTVGEPRTSPNVGEYALPLVPDAENQMFGRSDFYCHGDEIAHPGQHLASDGCIIQALQNRKAVWNSLDHRLQVVAIYELPSAE